jgi:hypothetical protein
VKAAALSGPYRPFVENGERLAKTAARAPAALRLGLLDQVKTITRWRCH